MLYSIILYYIILYYIILYNIILYILIYCIYVNLKNILKLDVTHVLVVYLLAMLT